MPRLKERGKNTSASEVTNIAKAGFWLLHGDREYFIAFSDYPFFAEARVQDIYDMKAIAPDQLRWDALDCDIEIKAIESPESYPLIYK